jgi:hypothetical protein
MHAWFSHFGVALGQSLSLAHWAHDCSTQIGRAGGQSLLRAHSTQRPSAQGLPPQSAGPRQATQLAAGRSQRGFGAAHWTSLVHPARQRSSSGAQIGAAAPQSAFERQPTQVPLRGSQRG